jgi:hypothetical protein
MCCAVLGVSLCDRKSVVAMLRLADQQPEVSTYAKLYLLAYAFLLRVPSEGLPVVAGGGDCAGEQAALTLEGDVLVLQLRRRKNKPGGSTLRRHCWCATCRESCPVHILGPMLGRLAPGEKLFPDISPAAAGTTLKRMLECIGVKEAGSYRLHDLRRGHALDLQRAGES